MHKLRNTLSDPDTAEITRDNLIGLSTVLKEGRFKLDSYINAVKYVSFKLMKLSNFDAYVRTFPEKYLDFNKRGVLKKTIQQYVYAYNQSKLVYLVYEAALMPVKILNADKYQDAINVQAYLMNNSKSDMVRTTAANSILNHLRRDDTAKIDIDIKVHDVDALKQLNDTSMKLAEEMRANMLAGKMSSKNVAEMKLVNNVYEAEE